MYNHDHVKNERKYVRRIAAVSRHWHNNVTSFYALELQSENRITTEYYDAIVYHILYSAAAAALHDVYV